MDSGDAPREACQVEDNEDDGHIDEGSDVLDINLLAVRYVQLGTVCLYCTDMG